MLRRFFSFLAFIIVLFLIPLSFVGSVRNAADRAVAPVGGFLVAQSVGLRNFFATFGQLGTLRTEREALQQQVFDLQKQLSNQQNLAQENADLRQELGVTGIARDNPKVFARIILQNTDSLDHTFTINMGSDQGVKKGQPAVYQGYLVGRVIEVRADTAVVRSVVSTQSLVQAWVASNHELGILQGEGNTANLTEITQGVVVPPNTTVETSGLGGSLPQGIPIGQIGQTESAQSDLSQSFGVNLPYNPKSLSYVMILLIDVP